MKHFSNVTDLKKEMLEVATKVMKSYVGDLIYDLERADKLTQEEYDCFFWLVRESGTHTRECRDLFNDVCKSWGEKDCIIKARIFTNGKEQPGEQYYGIRYIKIPEFR